MLVRTMVSPSMTRKGPETTLGRSAACRQDGRGEEGDGDERTHHRGVAFGVFQAASLATMRQRSPSSSCRTLVTV